MGCDIHLFVETKQSIDSKPTWVNSDNWRVNRYFKLYPTDEKEYSVVPIWSGRDYAFFSILANVRNYHDNKYISEPKGVPIDCSEQVLERVDYWDGDGHSHSWFTLKELKEGLSGGILKRSGFMSPEDAKKVDNGEEPEVHWQGGNIKGQTYREWESESVSLKHLIASLEDRKKDVFRSDKLEYDEKIRVVFWFDN